MSDEEIYARLESPKTIVIRYGHLRQVAEFPYDGEAKPGCGSKLVARTWRGTEVVEMLTTTCSNSGCGKSISRREMLDYIENSGGKDYPFTTKGRVLRVATIEDLNQQSALEAVRREAVRKTKAMVAEMQLPMKIVEVEPILGGETMTFYYLSEDRVDFRELVPRLASEFKTRIEMRQVGARDEARLVADYERCGQHCCCKNFLKVLKPVSMRQAKVQKATLDPLKISGRCGRLMCCLRYEDQTYKELKANLPHRNTRVGTSEGPGVVVDSKILVQLVLVRLEHNMQEIAVPVEELMDPAKCPKPRSPEAPESGLMRDGRGGTGAGGSGGAGSGRDRTRGDRSPRGGSAVQRASAAEPPAEHVAPQPDPLRGMSEEQAASRSGEEGGGRRKRRRRRRRGQREGGEAAPSSDAADSTSPSGTAPQPRLHRHDQQDAFRATSRASGEGGDIEPASSAESTPNQGGGGRKRKRRRRRRRGGGGDGSQGQGPGGSPTPGS